jgi:hypothetical protein
VVDAARRGQALAMLELFDASCGYELRVPVARGMARHSADIDNLRAALDWCFGPAGDAALGAALAGASAGVWREGPGRVEGVRRLALALDAVDAQTPPLVEVRLCLEWTMLAMPQAGERELALAQRCIDLCRAIGDRARLALGLGQLARIRSMRDEMDAALQAIDEQQSLVRADWPAVLRARVLLSQGCVLFQARAFEACLAANEEVYRLAAELDDPLAIASALVNQEQCAAALGRWQECVERGRDLMALVERQRGLYTCLESTVAANFCLALVNAGAFDEALEHVRRTRPLFARTGGLLCVIDALGIIALEQGGRADAARIMGCADAHYAQGGAREPVEESMHVALSQRLAAAFAPAQLRQLLDEGAALDAEAAAALVLRDAGPLSPGASRGSAVPAALPDAPGKHRAHA